MLWDMQVNVSFVATFKIWKILNTKLESHTLKHVLEV